MNTANVFLYKFDISQGYHHIDIDHIIMTKAMPCLVKILEKVRDKKFAYLLTTVLDPPSRPLSLDLVRKKQNSLKAV